MIKIGKAGSPLVSAVPLGSDLEHEHFPCRITDISIATNAT
jgi:hypothetical protein